MENVRRHGPFAGRKNHFKAEIRYRDDRGNVESRHFEGTPDQIRQHLEDQKDLPWRRA